VCDEQVTDGGAARKPPVKPKPQSMFRRPLTGDLAGRLYTTPPLPPTTTTLAAFKCLLLDRLQLLRLAGKFHVDAVLPVPKELQQELDGTADAVAAGATGPMTPIGQPCTARMGRPCMAAVGRIDSSMTVNSCDVDVHLAATCVTGDEPAVPVKRSPGRPRKRLHIETTSSAAGSAPAKDTCYRPTAGTSEAMTPAQKKQAWRNRAKNVFFFSYPQVIRSEWYAQHWMKTIRTTHDYQMLRSRFLALFLWPALLSSVRVKEDMGAATVATESSTGASSVATQLGSGQLTVESEQTTLDEDEAKQVDTTTTNIPARRIYR